MPTVPGDPWGRLYADVKIESPGVTDAVFKQIVFQVVQDFCDQTNIWFESVPITGQPNVTTYPFDLTGEGKPNRLMVLYNPQLAPPNIKRWVQQSVGMQSPGTITIVYAPSEQVQWLADVAKTPMQIDTDGYPLFDEDFFWIVDKYQNEFRCGCLGRLQAMPAKTFTNPTLAKMNRQDYITGRGKARTDALKENAWGGQPWQFPQSFATVTRKGWA